MRRYNSIVINPSRPALDMRRIRRRNPTEQHNGDVNRLPAEAHALWKATYDNAKAYYKDAWDLAENTAWKAVKMAYPDKGGQWYPASPFPVTPPTSMSRLPDPGEMVELARALEYVVLQSPPHLDVYRFPNTDEAPRLYWSPRHKMLLIAPHADLGPRNPDMTGLHDAKRLYEDFNWNQQARGASVLALEDYDLIPLGMADSIVYRSGKGTQVRDSPPGTQEYIHQFADGVVARQGPNEQHPKAITFQGGRLDVVEAGIIN